MGWGSRVPTPAAPRGSQPRPCTPGPALRGFPRLRAAATSAAAARGPRCMRNGRWEQRRAGPGAPAAAHQPPAGPSFPLGLRCTAPPASRGDPEPPRARGRSLRAHPARAEPGARAVRAQIASPTEPALSQPRARKSNWPRGPSAPATCFLEARRSGDLLVFLRAPPPLPGAPKQSGPAGWLHLAQVGAGARGPPCAEPETLVGWGAEDSELRPETPSLRLVAARVA